MGIKNEQVKNVFSNAKTNRIKCNASEILKKANIVLNKVYVHCKVSMTNIINVNETMNK